MGTSILDGAIRENFAAPYLELEGNRLQVLDSEAVVDTDLCASAPGRHWIYSGSLRRLQDTIGVGVRLTQCPGGNVPWSDSWSFPHDDLVSIADEVASRMLAESHFVSINSPDEPGTVRWYMRKRKHESTREALARVDEAIASHPDEAARFRTSLLELHHQILIEGWGDPPSENVAALEALAEAALAARPNAFLGQLTGGFAALYGGEPEVMLSHFERAVQVGGELPVTHGHLARALALVGRTDEALRSLETALTMSPGDSNLVSLLQIKSLTYFAARRYEEAREAAREAVDLNANTLFNSRADAWLQLAASSAHLGREEEARRALANARELRPALDEAVALLRFAAADPDLRERYLDGLRRAGLREDGLVERSDSAPGARMLAILPFENVSDDAEVEPLARGMGLAIREKFRTIGFRFADPSTTAEYGDTPPCVAAQEIQATMVYDGRVERFGDQVRVFVELVGCPGETRLWSQSYDGEVGGDLLDLRDKIAESVLATSVNVINLDRRFSQPESVMSLFNQKTPEANAEALRLARQHYERGSGTVPFGLAALQALVEGWVDSPSDLIVELDTVARDCVEIQPQNDSCHFWEGIAALLKGEPDRMVASLRRMLELVDVPAVHAWLGWTLAIAGETDEALESIAEAFAGSPEDAATANWLSYRALAFFGAGRYEEARDAARLGVARRSNDQFNNLATLYQTLAASHAHLGEIEAARTALDDARRLRPRLDGELALVVLAAADEDFRHQYLQGLRLAGLDD